MGSENNFNGIYFHHHFYLKTGVSRNGFSLGYSEQDTSTVISESKNDNIATVATVFTPNVKIMHTLDVF